MELSLGQRITVVDTLGRVYKKRALSAGDCSRFLACDESEWAAAQAQGREPEPEPFPWPIEDIQR